MGRVITGLLLAIAWFLLLLYGNFVLFCLVVAVGTCLALHEYLQMACGEVVKSHKPIILFVGLFPLIGAAQWGAGAIIASLFIALLLLIILTFVAYPALQNALGFLTRLWFGIFYVGFCCAHLILLRNFDQGILWLIFLTAITIGSDSAAFYIGRGFGTTKLYPALSPGKTRAGAVGGIIGGMLGGTVVVGFFLPEFNLLSAALLTFVLSCIGIIGDLVESLIKRASGVKDSGQLLPGHGGLLDRFDSLLLTAPSLYYLLHWGWGS
jgi:phosphatidate cytidylyltransferase